MKSSDAELRRIVAAEVASVLAAEKGGAPRARPVGVGVGAVPRAAAGGTAADIGAAAALARAEVCASCLEQERRKSGRRAVVTTTGKNQKGMVAKIAQGIADAGGDILDISQTLVADYFTRIIVVDMTGLEVPFAEFKARITRTVQALGAECLVMHEEVVAALQRV